MKCMKGSVAISVALKRINKVDVSKSVIDEAYITDWIPNINKGRAKAFISAVSLEKLSFANLFEFYKDFADRVKLFCVCEYMKEYKDKRTTSNLYQSYQKIKELEDLKRSLRGQIKKDADFAKKVAINVEIRKIEKEMRGNSPL